MTRRMSAAVALWAALGCSGNPMERLAGTGSAVSPPDAFTGVWRSVTPSLEFIGLSVYSKSSEMGVLAVRLTYSGSAFEGGGRIEGDSLIASMTVAGTTQPSTVLIAYVRDGKVLHVEQRSARAAPTGLTLDFVREP